MCVPFRIVREIPEIIIRSGKLVEPSTGHLYDPVPVMRELESLLSTDEEEAVFYIIDEDGMTRNRFDMDVLERLAEEFRVWFKGGFRKSDFLMDALILGAEIAVMDTSTMLSPSELKKAVDMSDSVALSIEFGKRSGWSGALGDFSEILNWIEDMNLHSVIFSCKNDVSFEFPEVGHRKYSHGCPVNGVEGRIVPYELILHH